MASIKLIKTWSINTNKIHSLCFLRNSAGERRCFGSLNGVLRKQVTTEAEDVTKFTGSEAAKWKAKQTFGKKEPTETVPRIEGNVFLTCIAVMLVYFGILREENDLDDQLKVDLFDRVPGLKVKHEIHLQNLAKAQKELEEMRLQKK